MPRSYCLTARVSRSERIASTSSGKSICGISEGPPPIDASRGSASIHLDVQFTHQPFEFLGLLRDVFAKFLRRARGGVEARLLEGVADCRVGERLADFRREPLRDGR